jgi:hypothetical protein
VQTFVGLHEPRDQSEISASAGSQGPYGASVLPGASCGLSNSHFFTESFECLHCPKYLTPVGFSLGLRPSILCLCVNPLPQGPVDGGGPLWSLAVLADFPCLRSELDRTEMSPSGSTHSGNNTRRSTGLPSVCVGRGTWRLDCIFLQTKESCHLGSGAGVSRNRVAFLTTLK